MRVLLNFFLINESNDMNSSDKTTLTHLTFTPSQPKIQENRVISTVTFQAVAIAFSIPI